MTNDPLTSLNWDPAAHDQVPQSPEMVLTRTMNSPEASSYSIPMSQ